MNQEQPRRPEDRETRDSIQYGDVFNVSGDLASKTVAPQDANLMQSSETAAFGQTQSAEPAEVMRSATTINEPAAYASRGDLTDAARDQGVTITGAEVQVVEQYVEVAARQTVSAGANQVVVTTGEALEATIQTAGNKPVDQSDAEAVREAEIRATGSNSVIQGGPAASAQSAAAYNSGMIRDEDKIKLKDVLAGASEVLQGKAVNRQDAEAVVNAELRNSPNLTTHPGGVASSMETAATLNENANVRYTQ